MDINRSDIKENTFIPAGTWISGACSKKGDGYFSIYSISCGKYFYIGYTSHLARRFKEHNRTMGKKAMWFVKNRLGYKKWDMLVLKTHIPTMEEAFKWENYYQIKYKSVYQLSLMIDNDYFCKHHHNNPSYLNNIVIQGQYTTSK